jgi:hypothetical protein
MDPTREDLLIGRVVDRSERPDDWQELERLFAGDPALRQQLCATLRDDAWLRLAVAGPLAFAERVEAPPRRRLTRMSGLVGWLCAAAFALLWLSPRLSPAAPAAPPPSAPVARDLAATSTQLGELPPLLVRSQPTDDGTALRVVTMRRILEENVVQQVFSVGADEFGGVQQVPVALASCTTPTDF